MKRTGIFGLALALATAFGATAASAAPVLYCKVGPGIDLANIGCISGTSKSYPGGGDGVYTNAGGGDSEAAVEAAILGATGKFVDISLYGKSDSNAGLFAFNGDNNPTNDKSGSWDVLDNSVLIKYITIKAANSFALYELPGAGANFGSFSTLGMLNNGGQRPNVSHISFWTVAGAVPEPGTWAMMISGFGLIGFALRRRGAAKAEAVA